MLRNVNFGYQKVITTQCVLMLSCNLIYIHWTILNPLWSLSHDVKQALSILDWYQHEATAHLIGQAGRKTTNNVPQAGRYKCKDEPNCRTEPVFFCHAGEKFVWSHRTLYIYFRVSFNMNTEKLNLYKMQLYDKHYRIRMCFTFDEMCTISKLPTKTEMLILNTCWSTFYVQKCL